MDRGRSEVEKAGGFARMGCDDSWARENRVPGRQPIESGGIDDDGLLGLEPLFLEFRGDETRLIGPGQAGTVEQGGGFRRKLPALNPGANHRGLALGRHRKIGSRLGDDRDRARAGLAGRLGRPARRRRGNPGFRRKSPRDRNPLCDPSFAGGLAE